jgi:hypothetical protein
MEKGEIEGIPRPDLISYNTVIKAMRSGNKEEGAVFAEDILSKLETMGERDPKLLPDNYSYTSVITAFGRSDSSKKADKALEIVERMMAAQEKGNKAATVTVHSFNAALNACAFVDGTDDDKKKAFEIAMKLNDMRMKYHNRTDSTWYGTMLRVCSSLLEPSEKRENFVDRFFREACDTGCVGRLVLTQLKFAATPKQFGRLLDIDPDEKISLDDLPEEWTCNAGDSKPSMISYTNENR